MNPDSHHLNSSTPFDCFTLDKDVFRRFFLENERLEFQDLVLKAENGELASASGSRTMCWRVSVRSLTSFTSLAAHVHALLDIALHRTATNRS